MLLFDLSEVKLFHVTKLLVELGVGVGGGRKRKSGTQTVNFLNVCGFGGLGGGLLLKYYFHIRERFLLCVLHLQFSALCDY